jgi:hypothetical protein
MCAGSLETNETKTVNAANYRDTDEADVHDLPALCVKLTTSEYGGATGKTKSAWGLT